MPEMWWMKSITSLSSKFVEEFCESKWTHFSNHLNKQLKYRVFKIAEDLHSHHTSFSGSKTTFQTLTITALPFPSKMCLWIQTAGSLLQHHTDKLSDNFSPQAFVLPPEFLLQYQCSYFILLQPIPHSHRPCVTTTWDFLQTIYFISVSTTQPVSFAMILASPSSSGSLHLFKYLYRITWQGCYIISSYQIYSETFLQRHFSYFHHLRKGEDFCFPHQ